MSEADHGLSLEAKRGFDMAGATGYPLAAAAMLR